MARPKRKVNPIIPAPAPELETAAVFHVAGYVRLSTEDSGKSGPDVIEAQKGFVSAGLKRFIIGLSKKVMVADILASVSDQIFNMPLEQLTASVAWLGIICYTFQIFFDFSGYSDMAIGLGRIFGFRFMENFNLPYISCSVSEFWRRWHISLSTWFRDYLYIPMGGNRKGNVYQIGRAHV